MDSDRESLFSSEGQFKTFREVSQVMGLSKRVYSSLTSKKKPDISYRKWAKIISIYYTDIFNSQQQQQQQQRAPKKDQKKIYDELIIYTGYKLESEKSEVEEAFQEARKLTYPLLSEEVLTQKISPARQKRLILLAGKEAFVDLLLRYYVLFFSEGLLLSIPPKIYQVIVESADIACLECFASPLNNNCFGYFQEYCSLFDEDTVFGALPSFTKYIDTVNFPVRLIINPPYTCRSIEMCVDKLVSYMNRVRGGEFIMFLPTVHCFDHLDKIFNYPGTCYCVIKEGEHCMFNYFTESHILTSTLLYVIVNVGGGKKSEQMLEEIRELLLEQALLHDQGTN